MTTSKSAKVWPRRLVRTTARPVFRPHVGMSTSMRAKVGCTFNRTGTAGVADAMNRIQVHGNLLGGPEEEPGELRHRQVRGQDVLTRNKQFEICNWLLL